MHFLLRLSAFLQVLIPIALVALAMWVLANSFLPVAPRKMGDLGERNAESPPILFRAPEISHEDIDGNQMKLSDFRGKVVMLDFWGNW